AGGADGLIAAALRGWPSPQSSPVARSGHRGGATGWRPSPSSVVSRMLSFFPGRLYIDIQRHLDPDEERFNQVLIALAHPYRLPLVATNDVRHARRSGRRLLDVLACIRNQTTLDAAGRTLLKNAERHLKPPAEMAALFRDLPEAIANTERIAEQCEFTLD